MNSKESDALGAVREWIQWNAINGSRVIWGSEDKLLTTHALTVRDFEELAIKIANAIK